MLPKVSVSAIPKVTHMGSIPPVVKAPPSFGVPNVVKINPANVGVMKTNKRVYRGSIYQYQGWTVIEETILPNGKRNILISKGKNIAELQNVSPASIVIAY